MDKNNLKDRVYELFRQELRRDGSGKGYLCPICGSGSGPKGTGITENRNSPGHYTCWRGCFSSADAFEIIARMDGLEIGSGEAMRAAYARYGLDEQTETAPNRTHQSASQRNRTEQSATPPARKQPEPPQSYTADIERFAAALEGSAGQSYLEGRGFTLETMRRFRLGFNAQKGVVTIPYNEQGSYYGMRSVSAAAKRRHHNLTGVQVPLFNARALYSSEVCFVVEAALCAISIEQAGGSAVAIGGTSGVSRLIDQLKRKPTEAALVLCLDNDEAGQKGTEALDAALSELGGVFYVDGSSMVIGDVEAETDPAYRKDPNDVLRLSGADALRAAVQETAAEAIRQKALAAQAEEAERQKHTGPGMVDTFLEDIQTRKYEPMPTGISDIDRAIGGGFIRQQLVLLGAAPGAGKTALAQWIFEGMAKRGVDCVFLNLEMSREQILARSLARIIAQQGQKIRTTDILQGYKWTEEQRASILAAAADYKETVAQHMIYNPDGVTANIDSIVGYIEGEAQRAEKAGKPAPCIVLDYLQIVSGDVREDAAAVIKRAVMELKDYAMRHNTVVFVIVAHNRAANATGNISMESGRDTSALEYSADLQLGLTFTRCLKRPGQQDKKPDDLTEEERREVTLRILKGRFGGMGREVDLYFDGETMTYTQTAHEFTPSSAPTPFDSQMQKRTRY